MTNSKTQGKPNFLELCRVGLRFRSLQLVLYKRFSMATAWFAARLDIDSEYQGLVAQHLKLRNMHTQTAFGSSRGVGSD